MSSLPDTAPNPRPQRRRGDDAREADWLARSAAGDLRSFECLYRDYHPRLTRFLERMLWRGALVGEVLGDTMLVVWRRASSFDGSCKVSTWIFAIAYRKALKALERLDEPLADAADEARADAVDEPDRRLGLRELQARLAQALAGLSPQQRAVVELSYYHGIDYREIAAIVECPPDTVKTRMFHARRRLRTALGGALEDWL